MSKKILILDDEKDFISTLKNFLSELSYTVDATMFPTHALEIIEQFRPEIVLFDYKLPDMDGDVFLAKAKELSSASKYVLMTAYRDEAIIDKFKSMGVSDVLLKPIDLSELLSKLRGWIGENK